MLYDFGPRLLKLRKEKNLTQQMVVERAKGFDPNLRLSDSVLGKYESDLAVSVDDCLLNHNRPDCIVPFLQHLRLLF